MKNSNSRIFRIVLDRLCEIEKEWKPPAAIGGEPIIIGIKADSKNPANWEYVSSAKCLPYKKLRRLLDLEKSLELEIEGDAGEGERAVESLDSLPGISGFSVYQVIDGCAHAIKFAAEVKKQTEFRNSLRYYRNSHPLTKNPERIRQCSVQLFKATLAVNPSVSFAGKLLSLSNNENSASEISERSRNAIRQHKYGCMYYQSDRLNNHPPTPTALLAFNLEWIFRHWPLDAVTFPTWPPRKQMRGKIIAQRLYKPRRDIVARFINAIFPSNYIYDDETLNFNLRFPKNAEFCGW